MRKGMIPTAKKPDVKQKTMVVNTNYSDCSQCKNGEEVEFKLWACHRNKNRHPTPQPNCKVNRIECAYFESKEEEQKS